MLPFITSTYPTNGSNDVAADIKYKIYFARDILKSSISSNTVYVTDTSGNKIDVLSYDYSRKELIITFTDLLPPNKTFYVILVGGSNEEKVLLDIAKNPMPQPYKFRFTTKKDELNLAVNLISPSDGSIIDSPPLLKWDAKENQTYRIQVSKTNTFDRIEWFTLSSENEVRPNINLNEGTYYWRVQVNSDYSQWSEVFSFAYENEIEIVPPDITNPDDPEEELFYKSSLLDIENNAIQVSPNINIIRIKIPGNYNKNNFDKSWLSLKGSAIGIDPRYESHGDVKFSLLFEEDEGHTIVSIVPYSEDLENNMLDAEIFVDNEIDFILTANSVDVFTSNESGDENADGK